MINKGAEMYDQWFIESLQRKICGNSKSNVQKGFACVNPPLDGAVQLNLSL